MAVFSWWSDFVWFIPISGGAREGLAGASAPPRKTKAPPNIFFSGSNFIQPIL